MPEVQPGPPENALLFKEYGRNIQNMVQRLREMPEREDRNRQAGVVIELMRMLNPEPGNETPEYYQKLWDHLYIMAGFDLDVDAPFPKPEPEEVFRRPPRLAPIAYRNVNRTYGRNLYLLIERAIALEDEADREGAIVSIGRLIKGFYAGQNRELMDDKAVVNLILEMSNGKLKPNLAQIEEEGLFNLGPPIRREGPPAEIETRRGGKRTFFKKPGGPGGPIGPKRKRF